MRVYFKFLMIIFLGFPLCQKENATHKDGPPVAVTEEHAEHGAKGAEHDEEMKGDHDHESDHDRNESDQQKVDHDEPEYEANGNDESEHEEHAGEKPRLSPRQVENLGLVLAVGSMLRIEKNTYRLPHEALVQVKDYTEIYTIDSGGALERHAVKVMTATGPLRVVQTGEIPPDTRIVTKGAARARLAWLNASNPAAGHGH